MCNLKLYVRRWQGRNNRSNVVAERAAVKDMSKHIIVSLIAVHNQENCVLAWLRQEHLLAGGIPL